MRRLKKSVVVSGLVAVIAVCFGYPAISSYFNDKDHVKVIQGYSTEAKGYSEEVVDQFLSEADAYNQNLLAIKNPLSNPESVTGYEDTLNVQSGMMGYLEIPSIDLKLPIYHFSSSDSLERGVGHMVGTSLPCGGESTHAVLSSHNGMSDRTGFTNLELLEKGNVFTITVLSKTLTYQVDQIKTVLPDEYEDLTIVDGEDLVTLLTCTPYGINSHRLLVRGHRIENIEVPETVEGIRLNTQQKIIIGTLILSAVIVAGGIIVRRRKKTYAKNQQKN